MSLQKPRHTGTFSEIIIKVRMRRLRQRQNHVKMYPTLIYCANTSFGRRGLCGDLNDGNKSVFTFLYNILDIDTVITWLSGAQVVEHLYAVAFRGCDTLCADYLVQDTSIPQPGIRLREMSCHMYTGILYIHHVIEKVSLSDLRDVETHIREDHHDHLLANKFLKQLKVQQKLLITGRKRIRINKE